MSHIPFAEKKFLLVDDHPLIRSALNAIIKEDYTNAVIHELANGNDLVETLKATTYDLIIMDIQMPNCETLWCINHIHVNYPAVPVLIYSMTAENIYALRVLKAGAKGFVSKEASKEEIKKAIDLAINGKIYLSDAVTEMVSLQTFKKTDTPFTLLSPREFQITVLLLAGHTVSGISKMLDIGNSTVGTHKGKIYQKLQVADLLSLKKLSDIYLF
jgi:two-component system, NarL family, invasion response regulator UvrY